MLSFPVLGRHLGPWRWRPLQPEVDPRSASESARVRARARENRAVMSDVAPPRWSLAPGPTPPSSHPANPEVEEEARRRWQSGQGRLVDPYPAACLGLGAGWGWKWPGQSGLDRAGEALASAELQGKYQKLAQGTLRYPSYAGSRGPRSCGPGALAATCRDRGKAERGHAGAPLLSPPSVSTITALPPAVPRRWGRAVSGRCAFLREGAGVWFFLLIELAGLERDVRNPGFRLWCWSGGAGRWGPSLSCCFLNFPSLAMGRIKLSPFPQGWYEDKEIYLPPPHTPQLN